MRRRFADDGVVACSGLITGRWIELNRIGLRCLCLRQKDMVV